jgi:hypothetical protein
MMVCLFAANRRCCTDPLSITAALEDLDDPLQPSSSDRAPLTGNIQSSSSRSATNPSYLTSAIPGEDRRAPTNTIDESVWDTLSRDLTAVGEKLRLVMWPKFLLGGFLMRGGGGIGGGADPEAGVAAGVLGRWPDADTVLQANMSEGLRDWDLWYVRNDSRRKCSHFQGTAYFQSLAQLFAFKRSKGRSDGSSVFRCVYNGMGRQGACHFSDQAAWW